MYKWPRELVPSVFQGLSVESICFSLNTININFNGEYSITLESKAQLIVGQIQMTVEVPPTNADILRVLGKTVIASTVDQDGASLILEFDDVQLRLDGDNDVYECFHLRLSGREFII